MSSILKVDTIQDQSGNNIINESGNVITIGASGDTITVPAGATVSGFTSAGIDDNATSVAITIDSSENVGIKNTTPSNFNASARQLVVGSGSGDNGITIFAGTSNNSSLFLADGTVGTNGYRGSINYLHNGDALTLHANATETMRLTNGKVGIGTTSPSRALTVSGSTAPVIAIVDTGTSGTPSLFFGDSSADNVGKIQYANSTNSLSFVVNSSERMNIANSGRVGINVTSPSGLLHVQSASSGASVNSSGDEIIAENSANAGISILSGNSNQGQLIFGDNGDNNVGRLQYDHSSNSMQFIVNASERARFDSSGNLLIATTSTDSGTAGIRLNATGFGAFTRDGGQVLTAVRLSSDGEIIRLKKDTATIGTIGARGGNLYVGNGDVALKYSGTNHAIFPSTAVDGAGRDNAIDLGASGTRFKDIYLGGGAFIGGTGTANKLDDYEEGTWTPSITTGGGTPSVTYAERTGKYTKIGNVVYYEFYIETSAFSGGSGSLIFGTFPFTIQAGRGAIGLATGSRVALGIESAAIIPDQNATTFKIRIKNSTGTGSSNNLSTLEVGGWSNLNPTILYGAGYYRTDS